MSDRRQHQRFVLGEAWDGTMRVLHEVSVEQRVADELVVTSRVPPVVGDDLVLDLMGGGAAMSVPVRVVDSRPIMTSGALFYQVRLAIVPAIEQEVSGPAASGTTGV